MKYAILPCSGLDKPLGSLAREVALCAAEDAGAQIVCPVLLEELPLAVVDGCGTRCATKLAAALGLKVSRRLLLPEALKKADAKLEDGLRPGPAAQELARCLAAQLCQEEVASETVADAAVGFAEPTEFLTVTHEKFAFPIPIPSYLFNENDCWVQVSGTRARVGISDYMQQSLTDITFFEAPEVGGEVEQFGELGAVESAKAVFEIISPVSGRIVATNAAVQEAPELINEHPYTQGWLVELELADLDADREFLLGAEEYAARVKQKAEEASG